MKLTDLQVFSMFETSHLLVSLDMTLQIKCNAGRLINLATALCKPKFKFHDT